MTRGGTRTPPYVEPYMAEAGDCRIAAAMYWARCHELMLRFEEKHPQRYHSVRYETLCAEPESTARGVFEFLHEPWEPDVLDYHRFAHDFGDEDGIARTSKGFSVSADHYRSWPPEILERAAHLAGDMLARRGYSVET